MRKWFLFLIVFLSCSVLASISVDSYNVSEDYVFLDMISGNVSLGVKDVSYDEKIVLSDGREVGLGDFLTANNAFFKCFPTDCSSGYSVVSSGLEKTTSVSAFSDGYLGFVLNGSEIVLDDIYFQIDSDFEKSVDMPLSLEFFEGSQWDFSEFSNEFLPKDWGCFNPTGKEVGALIGNSFYCEMINIGNTKTLKVGADVGSQGTGDLNMVVYPESGFGVSWECSFDPNTDDGCIVDLEKGEMVIEGMYQVCVGAGSLTDYKIYEDNSGDSCGFTYDKGIGDSVKDYGIFAQEVKYAGADKIGEVDFGGKVEEANNFILERYMGDCSGGCVLPLRISGINQNFEIYNVSLSYTEEGEWKTSNLVYDIDRVAADVDFNGTLDLGFLEIEVFRDGEYFAQLLGVDLFRKNITLLPAPIVLSVSPTEVPAGVPVTFYVNVDFDGNESLVYQWDFGDGEKVTSDVAYASHLYRDLGNYTLSVKASAGDLSSEKSFEVVSISPEEAVALGLESRRSFLDEVRSDVESLTDWYKGDLVKLLELDFFSDELDRLEKENNNSFDAEDFRDVAVDLYDLNIPIIVGYSKFERPFLMTDLDDVNLDAVAAIAGDVSREDDEAYTKAVLTWQNQNMDVFVEGKDVFVVYWNEESSDVLSAYSVEVVSNWDRESYFVINKPFDELYFKEDVGARKVGESTVIVLEAGETKVFEFYAKGKMGESFFISPKLGSLVIEADIGQDCNFNLVCEEGENAKNCRSDCKPVGRAVLFFVVGILFLICIYVVLQVWYKRHYEAYLFSDRTQLYNLLMYISNARVRGMDDGEIVKNLKDKGWSGERVDYAIKKSLGKRIGMFEIVPVEKISAWMRDRKARKALAAARKVATQTQGQQNGNINKSVVRF